MFFLDFWREHKREFDAILFDIDGTLISGRRQLPGAAELLAELERDYTPYLFVTNDCNHSTLEKSKIVSVTGLACPPEKILSSGDALPACIRQLGAVGKKFFLMGDLGVPCFAASAGVVTTRDPEEVPACDGVLVGDNWYDWQPAFTAVFNLFLHRPELPFIAPNPDICWAGGRHGTLGIGSGGVAEAIKLLLKFQKVEKEVIYLGKPYGAIFDLAMERLQLADRRRVLVLGDSLRGDVAGANLAGMRSGLMLTGITTPAAAAKAEGHEVPEWTFPGIKND